MPFVLGLNHRTAPVDIREKLAISPTSKLPETLERLQGRNARPMSWFVFPPATEQKSMPGQKTGCQAREALKRAFETQASLPERTFRTLVLPRK